MGVTGELCYQFAGLYPASGPVGRWQQGRPSGQRRPTGCAVGISRKHRIRARGRLGLFRSHTLLHRLILQDPDNAKYIQGITCDFRNAFARFRRVAAIFADPDAAETRFHLEWRHEHSLRILLLHLDDIPPENLGRLLARYRHGPGCECFHCGTLHADNMVLITTAGHCVGLIDARRIILIGDPSHCSDFAARAMAPGLRTIRSFDFPTTRTDTSVVARPARPNRYLIPANWSRIAGPSERMTLSF